jgi:hypothetical protein
MLDDKATWPDGGNGVEAGLMKMNELMLLGQFRIFDDLQEVIEEVREYHRKAMPNGLSQIVKVKDDLVDAIRYALMMARHAEQKRVIYDNDIDQWEEPLSQERGAMGY